MDYCIWMPRNSGNGHISYLNQQKPEGGICPTSLFIIKRQSKIHGVCEPEEILFNILEKKAAL